MSKTKSQARSSARRAKLASASTDVTTILLPIDESDSSREAGRLAVSLAKALNASLQLMHLEITERANRKTLVIDKEGMGNVDETVLANLSAMLLGRYSADALSDCEHVEERIRSASHSVVDAICSEAEQAQADLIIMGVQHRSRLDKLLRGSMTDRVLKRAPCPVTVVA